MSQIPNYDAGGGDPSSAVNGPAIGLMVTAGIGIAVQIFAILMNLLSAGAGAAGGRNGGMAMFSGAIGVVGGIIGIIVGVVILIGAMKMKKLESYGFAMATAIIAMVPCISPCCLLGLPFGIWALVVLMKPEVKSAFH